MDTIFSFASNLFTVIVSLIVIYEKRTKIKYFIFWLAGILENKSINLFMRKIAHLSIVLTALQGAIEFHIIVSHGVNIYLAILAPILRTGSILILCLPFLKSQYAKIH